MKIKVCGMTRIEQMQQLQELGIDYCGIIFYKGSKRWIGDRPQSDKSKIAKLTIKKVGVFVNEEYDTIIKAIDIYGLTAIQLHGNETDEYCKRLMEKTEVIKTFRIDADTQIKKEIAPFREVSQYFLFDTNTSGFGGSGKQFDWNILGKQDKPFFLSGGISPGDAEKIKSIYNSNLYAIDINSCFETAPGVKDIKKINQFISQLSLDER